MHQASGLSCARGRASRDVLASNARNISIKAIDAKRRAAGVQAASALGVIAPVKATATISSSSAVVFIMMAQRQNER